ncbi:MAG: hypothetical protein IPP48_13910 [Chitinophagaceae bacterium]|nr:hypothetical protein [Chitinophagaceae bacterium]
MKKYLLLNLFLSFSIFNLFAQNADSAWLRDNYYKVERMIPMRDGVKLFTALYIPKDSSQNILYFLTVHHIVAILTEKIKLTHGCMQPTGLII